MWKFFHKRKKKSLKQNISQGSFNKFFGVTNFIQNATLGSSGQNGNGFHKMVSRNGFHKMAKVYGYCTQKEHF